MITGGRNNFWIEADEKTRKENPLLDAYIGYQNFKYNFKTILGIIVIIAVIVVFILLITSGSQYRTDSGGNNAS